MTILKHELKQSRKLLLIWTAAILFFLLTCIFLYPEMKKEMKQISAIFSTMGAFSAAFGMDRLDFGSLTGFYAVECGTTIVLGGNFFAAIQATNILSKEEKDHTAEFLFVHPYKRANVCIQKLLSILVELILMNICYFAAACLSAALIKETVPFREFVLFHTAYFICQLEIALICFGISAFIRSNGFGIGLGLTMVLYFMSLIANISDSAKFLHLITPFGYTEGADIVANSGLDPAKILLGMVIGAVCAGIGAFYYCRKDLYC